MNKVKFGNRLPLNMDRDARFALTTLLREIEDAINGIMDYVMPRANHSPAITADTLVKTGKVIYRGFDITVVTAGGTIDIRDGVAAGGGVIIDTIPAATPAGTRVEKTVGIICETGLYVDYNGATGTLVALYES